MKEMERLERMSLSASQLLQLLVEAGDWASSLLKLSSSTVYFDKMLSVEHKIKSVYQEAHELRGEILEAKRELEE